ncbi:hypothetical protein DPMN_012690 [Dreissena polymorpha]|uniref:Uncharacterized protein n=1 Tax=Dreissena polymorpha TaxID=45954 RepID=A0A9D4N3W8_DREPO|nr:hypothetical protein DPMN_012690 [Dreissena polymorpha]
MGKPETRRELKDACGWVAGIRQGVQFRGETGARAGGGAAEGQGQRPRERGGHSQTKAERRQDVAQQVHAPLHRCTKYT